MENITYAAFQMNPEGDVINMFVSDQSSGISWEEDWLTWNSKKFIHVEFKLPNYAYGKSAALMHMLSNIVSKEVFQEGVQIYLKRQ